MHTCQTKRPQIARITQIVHDLFNKEQTQTRCASLSDRSTPLTATSKTIPPASSAQSSRQNAKTRTSSSFPKPASRVIRLSTGSSIARSSVAHSNRCKRSSTPQQASLQSSEQCAHRVLPQEDVFTTPPP